MQYRKIITIATVSIVVMALSSCVTFYKAVYDIGLQEVERPAQAKERYGEQKIASVQEEGVNKFYFEDELVKILWLPSAHSVAFSLENKTDHSIKIVWDEAAYVDENGASHRVMHSGIKFIDRNSPQPPSVIVRKGNINDTIVPTDNIYFVSGQYGGWHESPLFPATEYDAEILKAKTEKYIGKTFQVLLPLSIDDVVNDYIFIFKINTLEIYGSDNKKYTKKDY